MSDVEVNNSMRVTLDSLCANEFELEINGERVEGVFRVSGLTLFKSVGATVMITKMVQRDGNNVFNRWLRETINAQGTEAFATRTVSVIAIDDGVETRRWTMENAWITAVSYSDFDSGSVEMIEECVSLQYDELRMAWSATDLS